MKYPFLGFHPRQRHRLFWWALGLTVIAAVTLQVVDAALKTPAAPQGIVSFELAGSPAQAAAILQSWDARAQLHAAFSLGFDYLFMLAYASAIALAALWVSEGLAGWTGRLGVVMAWAMGLAGLADAAENALLWRILLNDAAESYPAWASRAATLKFGIIGLALLYVLAALLMRVFRKR